MWEEAQFCPCCEEDIGNVCETWKINSSSSDEAVCHGHTNNVKFPDYQQGLFVDQADIMELALLISVN